MMLIQIGANRKSGNGKCRTVMNWVSANHWAETKYSGTVSIAWEKSWPGLVDKSPVWPYTSWRPHIVMTCFHAKLLPERNWSRNDGGIAPCSHESWIRWDALNLNFKTPGQGLFGGKGQPQRTALAMYCIQIHRVALNTSQLSVCLLSTTAIYCLRVKKLYAGLQWLTCNK